MPKDNSCPVELRTADKNLIRANAIFAFVLVLIYILLKNPISIIVLVCDFALRVIFGIKYSPISQMFKYFLKKANIKPILIDAWPKVFAAKVGLILGILILVLHFAGLAITALVFAFMFLIAAGLEAFFDFCVACSIYPYYNKIFDSK